MGVLALENGGGQNSALSTPCVLSGQRMSIISKVIFQEGASKYSGYREKYELGVNSPFI